VFETSDAEIKHLMFYGSEELYIWHSFFFLNTCARSISLR